MVLAFTAPSATDAAATKAVSGPKQAPADRPAPVAPRAAIVAAVQVAADRAAADRAAVDRAAVDRVVPERVVLPVKVGPSVPRRVPSRLAARRPLSVNRATPGPPAVVRDAPMVAPAAAPMAVAAAVAEVGEPHAVPGNPVRGVLVVKDADPAVLPARGGHAAPAAAANRTSRKTNRCSCEE